MIYKNNKSGQLRSISEIINGPGKSKRTSYIHERFGKKPVFIPVYSEEPQKVSIF